MDISENEYILSEKSKSRIICIVCYHLCKEENNVYRFLLLKYHETSLENQEKVINIGYLWRR